MVERDAADRQWKEEDDSKEDPTVTDMGVGGRQKEVTLLVKE